MNPEQIERYLTATLKMKPNLAGLLSRDKTFQDAVEAEGITNVFSEPANKPRDLGR